MKGKLFVSSIFAQCFHYPMCELLAQFWRFVRLLRFCFEALYKEEYSSRQSYFNYYEDMGKKDQMLGRIWGGTAFLMMNLCFHQLMLLTVLHNRSYKLSNKLKAFL